MCLKLPSSFLNWDFRSDESVSRKEQRKPLEFKWAPCTTAISLPDLERTSLLPLFAVSMVDFLCVELGVSFLLGFLWLFCIF